MKNNDNILDALDAHTRRVNIPTTHFYLNLNKERVECFIQTDDQGYYLVTNENECDVRLLKDKVKLKD